MDYDLDGRAARARVAELREDGRRWRLARLAEAGNAEGANRVAATPLLDGWAARMRAAGAALAAMSGVLAQYSSFGRRPM